MCFVMESREVIENIDSIYERFKIPKHMQMHMRRAAATVKVVVDNWTGEDINGEDAIVCLLLHDLGNVVRMSFGNNGLDDLYEESGGVDLMKKIKKEAVGIYGEDDHVATEKMCEELGISKRVMELMEEHTFHKNKDICSGEDMDLKICAYADQRIGPRGVLNLKVRLEEANERGKNRPWYNEFDDLLECALKIEEQVLSNTSLSEDEINDEAVMPYLEHINS